MCDFDLVGRHKARSTGACTRGRKPVGSTDDTDSSLED